jgi:hypothetical protein
VTVDRRPVDGVGAQVVVAGLVHWALRGTTNSQSTKSGLIWMRLGPGNV